METIVDRTLLVPLGMVISITTFFVYKTTQVVTKYVKLETKVESLEKSHQKQAIQLSSLNTEIHELNKNAVRLFEIIKKLEEKIT